ncbi:hypothetical protein CERZMDRAFT_103293 [Cercospora zeae-maydis SCOH1-5]|uniref:Uncharacterized protein n=1 Tax=Cercospora zeae-maydis SCOH1-5 TaxID=717836 RepID=A0A6A6F1X2_9PEZI|nr:hypothetical protein CERZMDRAFT_103293 [Cercospora zeae-maydis SCOH1-5]
MSSPSTPALQEPRSSSCDDSFQTQDSPWKSDMTDSFDFLDCDSSSSIYSQDAILDSKRFSQLPLLPPPLFSPKLVSELLAPPRNPRKSPEQFRWSMRRYMETKYAEREGKEIDCMEYLDVKDIAACMRVDSKFYDIVCKSWRAREKGWFGPLQLPMEVESRVLSRPDTNDFYLNPFLAVGLSELNKALVPFSLTEYELDEERDVWVLKVLIPVSALLVRYQRKWNDLRVAYACRGSYEVEATVYASDIAPLTVEAYIKCNNGRTVSGLLDTVMRAIVDEEDKPEPRSGSFQELLLSMDLMALKTVGQARMHAFREENGSIEARRWEDGGRVSEKLPSPPCEHENSSTKAPKRPIHTTRLPIHHNSTLWKRISDSRQFLLTSWSSQASSQGGVPKIKVPGMHSLQKLAQSSQGYGMSQLPVANSKPGRISLASQHSPHANTLASADTSTMEPGPETMLCGTAGGAYVYERVMIFQQLDGDAISRAVIITPPRGRALQEPTAAFDVQGQLSADWMRDVEGAVFYSHTAAGIIVWSDVQAVRDPPEGSYRVEVPLSTPHKFELDEDSPHSDALREGEWSFAVGVLRSDLEASRSSGREISWDEERNVAYVTGKIVSPEASSPPDLDGESVDLDGESVDLDGESVDLDGEPVDLDGEPVDLDGEPVDLDSTPEPAAMV